MSFERVFEKLTEPYLTDDRKEAERYFRQIVSSLENLKDEGKLDHLAFAQVFSLEYKVYDGEITVLGHIAQLIREGVYDQDDIAEKVQQRARYLISQRHRMPDRYDSGPDLESGGGNRLNRDAKTKS